MGAPLLWLLLIELMGLLVFPFTYRLFTGLPDRGWAFSKPLALLLIAYGTWLVGLSHTLDNSRWTVLLVLAVLAGGAWLTGRGHWAEMRAFLRQQVRMVAMTEGLFLAVFIAWVLYRSFVPDIAHTEQPMDLMFLNAVVTSPHYPPADPWLAGEPVSYYYFGYLTVGVLTMLSGLATAVAYNLALASTAALGALAAFGVAFNLVRLGRGSFRGAALAGVAAAFLLVGASNLGGTLNLVQAAGIGSEGFWQGVGIGGFTAPDGPSTTWVPASSGWWWFQTSRVIPGTINEFPMFSFVLGDLHPHVMSIPYVLLALGIALQLYLAPGLLTLRGIREHWPLMVAAPVVLGVVGAINGWDLPLALTLMGGAVFLHAVRHGGRLHASPSRVGQVGAGVAIAATLLLLPIAFVLRDDQTALVRIVVIGIGLLALGFFAVVDRLVVRAAAFTVALVAVAAFLLIPFLLTFDSSASGPLPLRGLMTRPLHLILVWGVTGGLALAFLVVMRRSILEPGAAWGNRFMLSVAIGFLPVVIWIQNVWGPLAYAVLVFAFVMKKLGFRWAGVDETALSIGSGISRILGVGLLVALLLYNGITEGEGGVGGARSAVSRLLVVVPMATVATIAVYGAWTVAQRIGGAVRGRRRGAGSPEEANVLALGVLAVVTLLIMGAELFYVVDIFGGDLRRQNTVFKLYYQAWMLMAVLGGVSLYYVTRRFDRRRLVGRLGSGVWVTVLVVALGAVLYFPLAAPYARASEVRVHGLTLDGQAHLATTAWAEYQAILWVRESLPRDAVVVESAVVRCAQDVRGCSQYTEAARLSGSTGRPTIIGWSQHEYTWGRDPAHLAERQDDVREIYETTDAVQAKELLAKYDASYVVVGPRERGAYGVEGIAKFSQIGAEVFNAGAPHANFVVYRLTP